MLPAEPPPLGRGLLGDSASPQLPSVTLEDTACGPLPGRAGWHGAGELLWLPWADGLWVVRAAPPPSVLPSGSPYGPAWPCPHPHLLAEAPRFCCVGRARRGHLLSPGGRVGVGTGSTCLEPGSQPLPLPSTASHPGHPPSRPPGPHLSFFPVLPPILTSPHLNRFLLAPAPALCRQSLG